MASTIDSGIDTGNDSNDSSLQEKWSKLDFESWDKTSSEYNKEVSVSSDESYPIPIHRPTQEELKQLQHNEPPTSGTSMPSPTASTCQLLPLSDYFERTCKSSLPNIVSSSNFSLLAREYPIRESVTRRPPWRSTLRFRTRNLSCTAPLHLFMLKTHFQLFRAVSYNNTDKVREMLMAGVGPNCSDPSSRTPLHLAACMGYADMVKLLLEYGADPNAKDSIGNTPLHLAACTNHVRVISLLMEAGTRLSEKDRAGHSPLQLAITKLNIMKRAIKPNLELQEQIAQVVQMMRDYMKREERVEPELLNRLFSVMKVKDSSEDVESNIQDLLNNLSLANKS